MTGSLTEAYLEWLGSQIRERETTHTFWDLCRLLHSKSFLWHVANDDNRVQDGKDLRREFHEGWLWDEPVSTLEVLIALSRRVAWDAGGSAPGWAWELIKNLRLERMHDPMTPRRANHVDEILDTLIWRTYTPDGVGGFFPLAWPETDQTKIEIWYQMSYWIDERHPDH